jgi:hypothetical protein
MAQPPGLEPLPPDVPPRPAPDAGGAFLFALRPAAGQGRRRGGPLVTNTGRTLMGGSRVDSRLWIWPVFSLSPQVLISRRARHHVQHLTGLFVAFKNKPAAFHARRPRHVPCAVVGAAASSHRRRSPAPALHPSRSSRNVPPAHSVDNLGGRMYYRFLHPAAIAAVALWPLSASPFPAHVTLSGLHLRTRTSAAEVKSHRW